MYSAGPCGRNEPKNIFFGPELTEIQLFSVASAADVVKMYIRLAARYFELIGNSGGEHSLGDQILPGDLILCRPVWPDILVEMSPKTCFLDKN